MVFRIADLDGRRRVAVGEQQTFTDRRLKVLGQGQAQTAGVWRPKLPPSSADPSHPRVPLGPLTVTLSQPQAEAIYYTLDGSPPTTSSLLYSGPISLPSPDNVRIRALSTATGYRDSDELDLTYLEGVVDFTAVIGHSDHIALRDRDGLLWCSYAYPSEVSADIVQVANPLGMGTHYLGGHIINPDRSLTPWGSTTHEMNTQTPALADAQRVAGGQWFCVCLRTTGQLAVWGQDTFGVLTNAPTDSDFIDFAVGRGHCLALHSDGSITAWGHDDYGQSTLPVGFVNSGIVEVAAGNRHSVVRYSDGSVAVWGRNLELQAVAPPSDRAYSTIAAIDDATFYVEQLTGDLRMYGSDLPGTNASNGVLADGRFQTVTKLQAASARFGGRHKVFGLRQNSLLATAGVSFSQSDYGPPFPSYMIDDT